MIYQIIYFQLLIRVKLVDVLEDLVITHVLKGFGLNFRLVLKVESRLFDKS